MDDFVSRVKRKYYSDVLSNELGGGRLSERLLEGLERVLQVSMAEELQIVAQTRIDFEYLSSRLGNRLVNILSQYGIVTTADVAKAFLSYRPRGRAANLEGKSAYRGMFRAIHMMGEGTTSDMLHYLDFLGFDYSRAYAERIAEKSTMSVSVNDLFVR